jgi:hypothetical protein
MAIDASCFDRVAASRRYATRTNYRFRTLKIILHSRSFGTVQMRQTV